VQGERVALEREALEPVALVPPSAQQVRAAEERVALALVPRLAQQAQAVEERVVLARLAGQGLSAVALRAESSLLAAHLPHWGQCWGQYWDRSAWWYHQQVWGFAK
jgi:hypothetical protein